MYRKDAVSASNRISNSLGLGVNVKKIPSLSNGTEEYLVVVIKNFDPTGVPRSGSSDGENSTRAAAAVAHERYKAAPERRRRRSFRWRFHEERECEGGCVKL